MQFAIRFCLLILLAILALTALLLVFLVGKDILTATRSSRLLAGTTCESYLNTVFNGSTEDKTVLLESLVNTRNSMMKLVDAKLAASNTPHRDIYAYCQANPTQSLHSAILGYTPEKAAAGLTSVYREIQAEKAAETAPQTGDASSTVPDAATEDLQERLTQEIEAYKQALQTSSTTPNTKN
jgi:hypothetical protein